MSATAFAETVASTKWTMSDNKLNRLLKTALLNDNRAEYNMHLGDAHAGYVQRQGHHLVHWCWDAQSDWAWQAALDLVRQGADINRVGGKRSEHLIFRLITTVTPDLSKLEALLALGARADVRDGAGRTLLLSAAATGSPPGLIQKLLHAGAEPNAQDRHGETALCRVADVEIARLLVAAGANVNHSTNLGVTPLMCATQHKSVPLIGFLLAAGANPNQADLDNETVLHVVSRIDDVKLEMIDALLLGGVDVAIRNRHGKTAIEMAQENQRFDIVDRLRAWQHAEVATQTIEGVGGAIEILPL